MSTVLKNTGWVSLVVLLSATPLWAQSAGMQPGANAMPSAGSPGYYAKALAPTYLPASYNQAPMPPDGAIAFQTPMDGPVPGDPGEFGPPMDGDPGFAGPAMAAAADPVGTDPWAPPYADREPWVGLCVYQGYDSWRGLANGDFSNNNGVTTGFNTGAPLPFLGQFGCGVQFGGSYGAYNFSGKSGPAATNEVTQQWFFTGGLYRKADFDRRFSGGFVYDVMMSDSFGAFNANPTLAQFRAQLAWAVGTYDELGVWGAAHSFSSNNQAFDGSGEVYFRSISQINLFWHHKFGTGGADSWLWVGSPDHVRFTDPIFGGEGSLAELVLGGSLNAPITDRFAVYGNFMYMKPTASPGSTAFASLEDSWNIGFGLAFYPGFSARSSTVAGRLSSPYMPVANNGTFIVNTNRTL